MRRLLLLAATAALSLLAGWSGGRLRLTEQLWQVLRGAGRGAGAEPGPPSPFVFSDAEARRFASLAQAAYCGPMANLTSWTCEPCMQSGIQVVPGTVKFAQHAEIYEPNASFAYVARVDGPAPLVDGCLLSIRGTELSSNYIRDMEFWLTPLNASLGCEGCHVEAGFHYSWTNIEAAVMRNLEEIGCGPHGGLPVFVTGHSLGAAMATLAVFSLHQQGFRVQMGMSFEAPRVGDVTFAKAFDKLVGEALPFFRVTYSRDAVVHLPFQIGGYRHPQTEVFYDVHGGHTVCKEAEDPNCANWYDFYLFHDHCHSPLVPGGDLCQCRGWVSAAAPEDAEAPSLSEERRRLRHARHHNSTKPPKQEHQALNSTNPPKQEHHAHHDYDVQDVLANAGGTGGGRR